MKRIGIIVVIGLLLAVMAAAQSDDCHGVCEPGYAGGLNGVTCWADHIHPNHLGRCANWDISGSHLYKGPGDCSIAVETGFRWHGDIQCQAIGGGGYCDVSGSFTCGTGTSRHEYSYNMHCQQTDDGVPAGTTDGRHGQCTLSGTSSSPGAATYTACGCQTTGGSLDGPETGGAQCDRCYGGICGSVPMTPDPGH